jgi:hypothetical protein
MKQPPRVVVAGDWHGHTEWATGVIKQVDSILDSEWPKVILHLGDFGVWPGRAGRDYLHAVLEALYDAGAELWFIDGNHEDFTQLDGFNTRWGPRIRHLPRGHRWDWHNRTWLAMGGAVSVDKVFRREGVSWWPEEEITIAQGVRAERGGPAEVMVCHDAPMSVPLRLPPPSRGWDSRDLARADHHRDVLQGIVDEVRPRWLMHGHYHLSHETTVKMAHGPVQVTGLDMDGAVRGNYRVLNVETMGWES